MNIGDKVYIPHDSGIEVWNIYLIEENRIYINFDSDTTITSYFNLKDFNDGKLVNLFDDYNKAEARFKIIKDESEARKQKYYESILDEALHSVTLTEVESFGELLKTKDEVFTNVKFKASLYKYKNDLYIVMYKFNKYNTQCVMFRKYTHQR